MFDIDRQLAEALNISRRNKVRNENSDINIHLQQEARLRSLSNSETSNNIRIENIPVAYWLEPRTSLMSPNVKQSQMYMQDEFTGIVVLIHSKLIITIFAIPCESVFFTL